MRAEAQLPRNPRAYIALVMGIHCFCFGVGSVASAQQQLSIGLHGGVDRVVFDQPINTTAVAVGLGNGLGGRASFWFGPSVFVSCGINVAECHAEESKVYAGVIVPSDLIRRTSGKLSRYELDFGLGGNVKRGSNYQLQLYLCVQALAWASYSGTMSTEPTGSRESFNRDLTGQKSDIGMKVSARFIRHLAGPVWVGAEPHGVVVIRDGARIDAPPGELMRPSVVAIYGCNLTVELHFPKVREK